MTDRIAYVFDRESDSPEPGMLIVLKGGALRFYSPTGGRYADTASRLNNGAIDLDTETAEEYFFDMADRYNGQSSLSETEELKGKHVRRYETLTRKWGARR